MGPFLRFFQAEDGIRDYKVTGVQTCALPIFELRACELLLEVQRPLVRRRDERQVDRRFGDLGQLDLRLLGRLLQKIGRASCRGRVYILGVGGYGKRKVRRGEENTSRREEESP